MEIGKYVKEYCRNFLGRDRGDMKSFDISANFSSTEQMDLAYDSIKNLIKISDLSQINSFLYKKVGPSKIQGKISGNPSELEKARKTVNFFLDESAFPSYKVSEIR